MALVYLDWKTFPRPKREIIKRFPSATGAAQWRRASVKMKTHDTNSCLRCQQLTEAGATGMQQCLPGYSCPKHDPCLHLSEDIAAPKKGNHQAVAIGNTSYSVHPAWPTAVGYGHVRIYRQFSWLIVFYKVLCVLALYRLS